MPNMILPLMMLLTLSEMNTYLDEYMQSNRPEFRRKFVEEYRVKCNEDVMCLQRLVNFAKRRDEQSNKWESRLYEEERKDG